MSLNPFLRLSLLSQRCRLQTVSSNTLLLLNCANRWFVIQVTPPERSREHSLLSTHSTIRTSEARNKLLYPWPQGYIGYSFCYSSIYAEPNCNSALCVHRKAGGNRRRAIKKSKLIYWLGQGKISTDPRGKKLFLLLLFDLHIFAPPLQFTGLELAPHTVPGQPGTHCSLFCAIVESRSLGLPEQLRALTATFSGTSATEKQQEALSRLFTATKSLHAEEWIRSFVGHTLKLWPYL